MKKILIILLGITLSYSSFALGLDVKIPSKDTVSAEPGETTLLLNKRYAKIPSKDTVSVDLGERIPYNNCIIELDDQLSDELNTFQGPVFFHSKRTDEYFIFDQDTGSVFKSSEEEYRRTVHDTDWFAIIDKDPGLAFQKFSEADYKIISYNPEGVLVMSEEVCKTALNPVGLAVLGFGSLWFLVDFLEYIHGNESDFDLYEELKKTDFTSYRVYDITPHGNNYPLF